MRGLDKLIKMENEQKRMQKVLHNNFYNDDKGYKTTITYKKKVIIVDMNKLLNKKKERKSYYKPRPKKPPIIIMPDSHKDMDHQSKEYKRMYHYLYHKKTFNESERKNKMKLEMTDEEYTNHKKMLLDRNNQNKINKYGTMYHYRLMNRMKLDNEVKNGLRPPPPSKEENRLRMKCKYRFKRCMYEIRGEDFNKSTYTPQRKAYAKTKNKQKTLRKKLIIELNMLINNIDNIQSILNASN